MKIVPHGYGFGKVLRSARNTLACLALAASASVAGAFEKPMVIELYTSQGCSSCPPADKLLGEIARNPNVIAISLPVDYWDYIGWKDTFGKAAHTARQKGYAKARGDGQVYTPQAVIDGVAHAVGSDVNAIRKAAAAAHGKSGAMSVSIKVAESGGGLNVELGAASAGAPTQAQLVLIRVIKSIEVTIGRGENSGRTIAYTNVGRSATRIGEWTGEPKSFSIPKETMTGGDADGWVLLLQAGNSKEPGPILAAAKAPGL
jgi:hypothetical protein